MALFKTALLFGGPGTGKGTQGKILGCIPGFHHCSSGDLFRSVGASTELGRLFHQYSSRGELVPDDITIRTWREAMDRRIATGAYKPNRDLLLLDGIPRTAAQAKAMQQHVEVLKVIYLWTGDVEAMMDRLKKRAHKESRADDANEDVIRNRWQVYERETKPVLDVYADELLAKVECIGTPAQVLNRALKVLAPLQAKNFNHCGC